MNSTGRSYWRLTRNDFEELKRLAWKEHVEFFERNPHLKAFFYESLIGICLCQGAASHYLNPKTGIKDFDIWHFYQENKNANFPYRAHKANEDGYKGKRIDFLKRAIPQRICHLSPGKPGRIILDYLREEDNRTKRKLLEKGIIGLWPNSIFGEVLWRGRQAKS